jgi:hypothetical protein
MLFVLPVLGLGGFVGLVATIGIIGFVLSAWFGLPLAVYGLGEGPEQPIAFPHTVHVQELGLDCTFCHRNVTVGAAATIPAVGLCMTCHKTVGDDNPEVDKLRTTYFDAGRPIDWVRVHRVPDHVQFVHEAHIRFFSGTKTVVDRVSGPGHIGVTEARIIKPGARVGDSLDVTPAGTCAICHGDVGSMVKVKQVRALKMGDCVDCHKDNSAPTDCTTCHY